VQRLRRLDRRFLRWEREQESVHDRQDGELLILIRALFADFQGRYGAPRIQRELARKGTSVSRKRVSTVVGCRLGVRPDCRSRSRLA